MALKLSILLQLFLLGALQVLLEFVKNSFAQFRATENVFKKKNIPFRSFIIEKRNEEVLGELFIFFILETILLGMAMKINPFDQPAVELIKVDTNKFLKSF